MKKAIVTVRGNSGLEEGEPMELLTEGEFYKEGNVYCISYKETDMTGMEGTVTTVVAEENKVRLQRRGTVTSEFIFEEGRKNISHYATEYGVFTVAVTAEKVDVSINESGGVVSVVFSLDFLGNASVRNEFLLTVREVGNEGHN